MSLQDRRQDCVTQCLRSVEWLPIRWLWRVLLWSQHPACTGKNPLTLKIQFVRKHAKQSEWLRVCFLQAKKHNLTVNLTTFRIWCYVCEREVFLEHRPALVPLPAAPHHHCKATEQVQLDWNGRTTNATDAISNPHKLFLTHLLIYSIHSSFS